MTNISPVTPPEDNWRRWRTYPGRNATLTILLVVNEEDESASTLVLRQVGHLVALAVCQEIRSELGPDQALIGFFVAQSMPKRWRHDLKPGQKFAVSMLRTWDERWEMKWLARIEDERG